MLGANRGLLRTRRRIGAPHDGHPCHREAEPRSNTAASNFRDASRIQSAWTRRPDYVHSRHTKRAAAGIAVMTPLLPP